MVLWTLSFVTYSFYILFWPRIFSFIRSALPLYTIVIALIIPSTLFLPLHFHVYSSVLFTIAA